MRAHGEDEVAAGLPQLGKREFRFGRVTVGAHFDERVPQATLLKARADAGERREIVGRIVPEKHPESLLGRVRGGLRGQPAAKQAEQQPR